MSPHVQMAKNIYEDTIGTLMHGGYYVYAHWDGKDCFYIGMGSANRAWETGPLVRNELWWQKASELQLEGNEHEVRIIAAGLEKKEAEAIERELIRIRKPSCNIANNLFAVAR